jgi:hypothetical protein
VTSLILRSAVPISAWIANSSCSVNAGSRWPSIDAVELAHQHEAEIDR